MWPHPAAEGAQNENRTELSLKTITRGVPACRPSKHWVKSFFSFLNLNFGKTLYKPEGNRSEKISTGSLKSDNWSPWQKSAKSNLVSRVLSYPSLQSDGLEREPGNEVEQRARDNWSTFWNSGAFI